MKRRGIREEEEQLIPSTHLGLGSGPVRSVLYFVIRKGDPDIAALGQFAFQESKS